MYKLTSFALSVKVSFRILISFCPIHIVNCEHNAFANMPFSREIVCRLIKPHARFFHFFFASATVIECPIWIYVFVGLIFSWYTCQFISKRLQVSFNDLIWLQNLTISYVYELMMRNEKCVFRIQHRRHLFKF